MFAEIWCSRIKHAQRTSNSIAIMSQMFFPLCRRFVKTNCSTFIVMAPTKKSGKVVASKPPPSIMKFMKSPQKMELEQSNGATTDAKNKVKNKVEETDDDFVHQNKRLKQAVKEELDDFKPGSPEDIKQDEEEKELEEEENVASSKKKAATSKAAKSAKSADSLAATDFTALDSRPHPIGAHVSIAGGVHNALIEARKLGASACAFFLRPPKAFAVKPLQDETVVQWRQTVESLKFNLGNIVVHAPYLLNIGSPKGEALERSRMVLFDDLVRCDRLGIKYYNIHPGSTLGEISADKCCKTIAESVNLGLKKSKDVVLLLENMAGQGNWVGSKMSELGLIISMVEDKERVGVCLDTCHAFAYGYGLNTANGLKRLLDDFSKHVGMRYLKAIHLNDSKGACGDNRDRHEDIGKGVIGKAGFKLFMNEPAFRGIPLILETPGGHYDKEIDLLHSFVNENAKVEKK